MPAPTIFISYRRDDARGWPVHLQCAFEQVFGHGQVFLDTRDIGDGEKYPEVLRQALRDAKVMVVLVGNEWNPLRAGHRRLDEDDDWVREEVRTGLEHCPLVLPVLLGPDGPPGPDSVPPDLKAFCKLSFARVDPHRSIHDVDRLIRSIGETAGIAMPGSSDIGLLALMRLARLQPKAVEAMGAARARLQHSCEQIDHLVARKLIHDQLHRVESDCLNLLRASHSRAIPSQLMGVLDEAAREIERCRVASDLDELVDSLLADRLPRAASALREAIAQRGRGPARQAAILALRDLLAIGLHPVDQAIADAAREVNLDLLAQELERMLNALPQGDQEGEHDADRLRIAASIERLRGAGQDLQLRVQEHGLLQRADSELRMLCTGPGGTATAGAALAADWPPLHYWLLRLDRGDKAGLRLVRESLAAGGCGHLARARALLQALDPRMSAPAADDATLPRDLRAAFDDVAREFRAADSALKDCCLQMGQLRGELATVLAAITA